MSKFTDFRIEALCVKNNTHRIIFLTTPKFCVDSLLSINISVLDKENRSFYSILKKMAYRVEEHGVTNP